MSNSESPSGEEPDSGAIPQTSLQRPRVWTVFLALLGGLLASTLSQGAVAIVLVANLLSNGLDPNELPTVLIAKLMTPPVFIGTLIMGQLAMLATALIAARLSPEPVVQRLGLGAARYPAWAVGLFAVGSTLPLVISVGAAHLMTKLVDPDKSVEMLYQQMTSGWAIPFIVAIGLFPGICEEIFFRGYMQRRFVERWGPWLGIIVSSIVFAVFHVTPHAMALALILGLWLGVIAYRSGSIWPGALCHGCINSGWNVLQVGRRVWGFPETFSTTFYIVGIIVIVILFVLATWVLVRNQRTVSQ